MRATYLAAQAPPPHARSAQTVGDPGRRAVDRSIGSLLQDALELSDQQIARVSEYQHRNGVRFGEAAVALKLATGDDVMRSLARQFHYPYGAAQREVDPELILACQPFSKESEVFRELRSQLLMGVLSCERPRRALAVVSPDRRDGKTFVSANIAVALSQLGGRTLLVDADMRTPRQHEVFRIDDRRFGLSSILSDRCEHNIVQSISELPGLSVLTAGPVPPNPLELVHRPSFLLLLDELIDKFDHVIVDTPANVHGADARVIAAQCGAALVIGRKGRTRMKAMDPLLCSLRNGPSLLAGVVFNDY